MSPWMLLVAALLLVTPGRAPAQAAPILVSAEWLAAELDADGSDLVVLHVGNEASFTAGHVPGAWRVAFGDFTPERDGLSTEMPDAAAFRDLLEGAGVTDHSRIVIYGTASPPTPVTRLWVTLEYFGLGGRASVLDGGLDAWQAGGHPVATEARATPARGRVTLSPRTDVLVDHTVVQARIADRAAVIVDARDPQFWSGAARNQQRAARAGRVPGAVNVPFRTLVDESGRLLEADALREAFARAGIVPGQPIVTYCHIGQQASLLFLAAKVLGHDVRMYDGSFEDWSRRPELPVEPPPG